VPLSRLLLNAVLLGAACAAAVHSASAQHAGRDAPGASGECAYTACALNIAPRWNGLAVVRGSDGPPLANLNFFWPRDITASLRGPAPFPAGADSAAAQARRAVRIRRIGAAFTDVGLVAGAIGAVGAFRAGRIRTTDGVLLGVGGAALGVSVPLQFAADGALSRAVWWHNRRYAR
jgi:hypothetical protein